MVDSKIINDKLKYCINIVLKEAREEGRLVKQIFYTMLSAYTNNPINLAINSYSVMKDWLEKSDKFEKLNFNAKLKIKEGLKGANKGYFPISLEKLKEENKLLYDIIVKKLLV